MRPRPHAAALLLALACLCSALAAAPTTDRTAARWEVLDLRFTADAPIDDPWRVTFGAILTHESGATMDAPGFHDGGAEYVLRIAPSREGRWTWRTYASQRELAGLEGAILITPNTRPDRHGAIRIDPDRPQRFVHEDGASYFALAFELDWLFALDWDNPDDIPRTRNIVSHLAANHFNQVVMNVYAYDAGWGERDRILPRHNFARPATFPYAGTNETPDHSRLNLAFFRHLDRVIAHLHEREIVAHLMIYVWNKQVNWAPPYSREDDLYFDHVIKRYQAFPNIVWDISKEALAYGRDDIHYITDRIDRLRRLDGHRRLVTVHDYDYCRRFPDKVDFISMQEWRPNLYNETLAALRAHPRHPIVNIEHGGYEKTRHSIFNGAYVDRDVCLDRAYQCLFAGAYTTYYWQNTSWYEVVFDPESLPPDEQPGLHLYRHLGELFRRHDFNTLVPAQYFYSPTCLTDHRSVFLYHLPAGAFALEGMAPPELRGRRVRVSWFDTHTGRYHAGGTRQLAPDAGAWTGFRRPATVTSPGAIAILEPAD